MKDVCFVIMPYGIKKDTDGKDIDFEEIYEYVIKEAVESVAELECLRCDDIEQPGFIHERMLRHILQDRVAIVDTSTLNANVFYELGIRHALRRSVTVLIRREGTASPFNIAGLNSIEYTTNPRGVQDAKRKIKKFIENGLRNAVESDSLVFHTLPDLRVQSGAPKPLTKVGAFEFPLVQNPAKLIALITGDREYIKVGDVWVNSENTDMQMDRYYGTSTSAAIRYLGAKKHAITGKVVEDTIGEELARKLGGEKQVDPGTVIPTSSGSLQKNSVKWIFHVASVIGEPREGYRPIERIERCVTNALRRADDDEFRGDNLTSILFPIFGTGPGGGDFREHAGRCINAAIEYLESHADSTLRVVYFYAWSDRDLEICRSVIDGDDRLTGK
jgi:O-acetyl-ADP-ribose deacetylase (regulator of RNase III)